VRLGRAAQQLVAALSSGSYGLALSRFLFERDPVRGAFFGEWPGALLSAGLGAGLGMLLVMRFRRVSAGACLALLLPLFWLFAPDVNLLRSLTLLLGALVLSGLLIFFTTEHEKSAGLGIRALRGWGLGVALFCLYLLTLAPTVGEADTFEFQVGIARLGIAHGSGYPLLMLIGKAFSLLPAGGTLAFRANLTSAFFGALAAVGVERVARRLGAHPLTALLVGLAFGVSPTLWSRAVEVEAYTLNAAFVVGILYFLIQLVDGSGRHGPRTARLLAFTLGLSLTNHLTTLVLAPACLLALLVNYRQSLIADGASRISRLTYPVSLLAFFLLGLSVYLYLPIRWPAVNHGELLSWQQFVNLLSGGEARGAFQWTLPFTDASRFSIVWRKVAGEYGWAGLGLAALGMIALAARPHPPPTGASSDDEVHRRERGSHKSAALILGLAYAGYAYFALAFNVPDPDFSAFLIPIHLIAAVLMGLGVQALLDAQSAMHRAPRPVLSRWVFCIAHCALCLLPLRSVWLTLPRVDQSRDWEKYRLGLEIFQPLPPQAATVLADSEKIAPLYYLQVAEGVRPDLDIIVLPDEASYRTVLDERVAAGQTVYLGRYLPGLGGAYALRSRGPLAEVSPEPFTPEAYAADSWVQVPLPATLAPNIQLLGYQEFPEAIYVGDDLPLTLYWGAETTVNDNYLVNLRLVNGEGQVAWQSAGRVPVGSLYPANAWRPGEVISDYHSLPIRADLAPGDYALEVGLFPPFQVPKTGWVEVASVKVAPYTRISPAPALPFPDHASRRARGLGCTVEISSTRLPCAPRREPASPSHPLRARFGDDWLLGYDAPESAPPGSRQTLTLYWLRTGGAESVTAFGETRSLAAWPPGSLVPLRYELAMPEAGDHFTLRVETGEPARCGWLAPITPGCAMPPIRLAGEAIAEGAINFDHQLVLTRATLDTPVVARGGQVEVTLHWQGLKTIAENYTVFVHLLGPDGLVHGQVDAWPVAGTLATSQWTPGQPIEDHYRIPLDSDAPSGDYSVEVGLYLLATLERLPVLNAEGAPVDDKVLIHGLAVR
jgi:hypothetical protein